MFNQFPKQRKRLPPEYRKIYDAHYKSNRAQKMEQWLHVKVASDLGSKEQSTLEIGAGTLNQLAYENNQPYDIIEPKQSLFQDSKFKNRIRHCYNSIHEVPITSRYERITSIATFEHILDLPVVVAKTCRLLDTNGSLRVSIPNEGTMLWKIGWQVTTGIEFRLKYGLDYSRMMEHEHVNTAKEIEEILNFFYEEVKDSSFGVSKKLSLYRYFECTKPRSESANSGLDRNT